MAFSPCTSTSSHPWPWLLTSPSHFCRFVLLLFLLPNLTSSSFNPIIKTIKNKIVQSTKDITGNLEDNLKTTNEEAEDDAIPDDESLIELSLPCGHYVGHYYTNNKNNLCLHNKVQDFKLFDLFTEFNDFIEEDNLIEIDISIGSIRYSRFEFEIKA